MATDTAQRPTPPLLAERRTASDPDVIAITEIVAEVERGFNTNDADLSVAAFAADAWAVNAMGQRLEGRHEILASHRDGYAGFLRDAGAVYRLADVHFVQPDVAIAQKLAWDTAGDADPDRDPPAMIATYVCVKADDHWWVSARHNTLIA